MKGQSQDRAIGVFGTILTLIRMHSACQEASPQHVRLVCTSLPAAANRFLVYNQFKYCDCSFTPPPV